MPHSETAKKKTTSSTSKKKEVKKQAAAPVVVVEKEDVVEVIYLDEVSPKNRIDLEYGVLASPGSYLEIPRRDFGGRFRTQLVVDLLEQRKLVVTSGLNDNERRRFGCLYYEGEVMTLDQFENVLDMTEKQITTMYAKLCKWHRVMVAKKCITAFDAKDERITLEKVKALNALSTKLDGDDTNGKGYFYKILKGMGEQLVQG